MSNFLERIAKLSPQRLSLLALDLNTRLEETRNRASEPLAVIGLACRFPGHVQDAESFWRLLEEGRDVVREVPPDRWKIDDYYDANPDAPGKMNTRWGGFLETIDQFDPEFFGISPREAAGMDPQQRLLLEVAWEALENAGQSPESLAGSATGVFAGLCTSDYYVMRAAGGPGGIDAYVATGNAHSVASGRISYVLGLKGPSVSIDTACSSSLVSIHLACQSLRTGECRMALAGGANLLLLPDTTITLSKAHMMSPEGRCKAFDASADGFVRAEGCGLIVLKRLSDARADGDRVLAVIRGTACNQDGRSSGLTAPNGPSQVAVIRAALANARLQPGEVDYIEAHGTGTSLGDPIEARALAEVFGPGRPAGAPLQVGTVKSNFGHAESAAGIAGVIKTILALQRGKIPASLHLKKLSPHIDWSGTALTVPTTMTDWHRARGQRVAGVSSFGFSGTNAHVVLGDAPDEPVAAPSTAPLAAAPYHLLALSAQTEPALRVLAQQFAAALAAEPVRNFAAVCRTAGLGRSHFAHRLALKATDSRAAGELLTAFFDGKSGPAVVQGTLGNTPTPGVVFMFTGQGAQYPNMGRELYDTQPVFRRELNRCAEILQPLLDRPLFDVLWQEPETTAATPRRPGLLDETQYTQPALFAVEYALAAMWRSWGVEPSALLGHSVGEYVAACVAGIFSLEDGLKLIAARGRLMAALPAGGAMTAVFADEARVTAALGAEADRVAIACNNGPENIVLSGERSALDAVVGRLKTAGISNRALIVSHAFHSPLMDPVLDEFEAVARSITFAAPQIALISNVTGRMAEPDLMTNAAYWRRHVRQPVRFVESIRAACATGPLIFLEVGPQPVLTGMAKQIVDDREILWSSSLKRDRGNWEITLDAAAALYVRGVNFDWRGLYPGPGLHHVALPTYPFQRQRYWLDPVKRDRWVSVAPAYVHPLLGARLDSPAISGAVFEAEMGEDRPAFLSDHRIFGRLIMPSPAFVEMAFAGLAETKGVNRADSLPVEIAQLSIREPLFLPEKGATRVQLILDEANSGATNFKVCSREAGDAGERSWRTHVTGQVRAAGLIALGDPTHWRRETVQSRCATEVKADEYYASVAGLGLEFGASFRGLQRIWRGRNEALGEMQLPDALSAEADAYYIHPALLDACFHLLGGAMPADAPQCAYLLIGFERLTLHALPPARMWNHTVLHLATDGRWEACTGDIRLYDDAGRLVMEVLGLQLRRATREAMARAGGAEGESWFHDLLWREQSVATTNSLTADTWVADFIPSPGAVADQLRDGLFALAAAEKLSVYNELIPGLGALSANFILRALTRLQWTPRVGESVDATRLADQLGVVPAHRRLLVRLLAILAEDGWLQRAGENWEVRKPLAAPTADLQAEAAAFSRRVPAGAAEIAMTARCGDRLDEVLSGRCDPLHLLFPNGDFDVANALYRRSPFARTMNTTVKEAVAAAMKAAPVGRTVRILEIGAGTGGTSSFVLPHLPVDRTRYTFTDVSPLFLSRARDEFQAYPFTEFALLDIEKSPAEQDFADRTFDIVIAANVLHATRDLQLTLQHAASLLAPGGMMVLLEGVAPSRWVDLTFGLTDGWWRFSDHELRRDYALISTQAWLKVLPAAGLTEAVTLIPSTDAASAVAQQAILLARKPAPVAGKKTLPVIAGYWILLADKLGVATSLALRLAQRSEGAVLVAQGQECFRRADGNYTIDPLNRADYTRLLTGVAEGKPGRLLGIISCWPLHENLTEKTTTEQWSRAQERIGAGMLYLTQAFAETSHGLEASAAKLWFVTRGAQAIDGTQQSEAGQPAQAMVWGLARVISLEQPARFGAVIDLDPSATPDEMAGQLANEIAAAGPEDGIAYRGKKRWVPRVVRASPPGSTVPLKLHESSSYLITGGLGGLGLHTARWLAERGAAQIVLLSRREFPDPARWASLEPADPFHSAATTLHALTKTGTKATVVRADVADETAMASLFARFGRDLLPLKGVLHAAVNMSGCAVDQMDLTTWQDMMRAKAQGAWTLHRLAGDLDLDFFVLFSSTTALWGVAGLGHYAAANQALDALAVWRRARGQTALSIRWGTWQEMRVANEKDRKEFAQAGLRPMEIDRALAAMEQLIVAKKTLAVVASIDWVALRAVYEARRPRPIFAEMRSVARGKSGTTAGPAGAPAESEIVRRLRTAPPARRRDLIVAHLRTHAGAVLGFDATREIPLDQGLFDMGMDSLMSVELKGRLEKSLGVPLPSTLTFNYPTVDALADFLLKEALVSALSGAVEGVAVAVAPSPAAPATPLPPPKVEAYEEMSEDDLEQTLLNRLKGLK